MALNDISPKYGGRNIRPAHGAVSGTFKAHITTGAYGCLITALTLNGNVLTAPQLAALGLDEAIEPGQTAWIGKDTDVINSITIANNPDTTNGGAWVFNIGPVTL